MQTSSKLQITPFVGKSSVEGPIRQVLFGKISFSEKYIAIDYSDFFMYSKGCFFENKIYLLLNKVPTKRCTLGTVSQPSSRFSKRFSVMEIFQKEKCPSRSGHFQKA